MKKNTLILIAMVLLVAACGSTSTESTEGDETPTTNPAPGTVVLIWSETGGCMQAGPNCARYEISADGTVQTFREGTAAVVASGSIPVDNVAAWLDAVQSTDFEALVARLGPGEMTAAFDGVDYSLELPGQSVTLSSVDVEFDVTEAFFARTQDLVTEAAQAAPLQLESR